MKKYLPILMAMSFVVCTLLICNSPDRIEIGEDPEFGISDGTVLDDVFEICLDTDDVQDDALAPTSDSVVIWEIDGASLLEFRPANHRAFAIGLRDDGVVVWKYIKDEK